MPTLHHVYLLPGFFGFVQFGKLVYFSHVREFLEGALSELGVRAEVQFVRVPPTASLRVRARHVLEYVRASAPADDSPIHLVGHSTGGLDARLLVTPGARLEDAGDIEPYARRVRSLVSVASPHRGTRVASFFSTLLGQKLLELLSLGTITVLRQGRWPLSLLVNLAAALLRTRAPEGRIVAALEHLGKDLVDRLPHAGEDRMTAFVAAVRDDQSLLPQLAPEAMDVFNASVDDRPGVRYGSVVARAEPPSLAARWKAGLSPMMQAMVALYAWLHRQAILDPRHVPRLDPAQEEAVRAGLGAFPTPTCNDAIVPTLSQVWGDVIYAARADHLDVIGHFDDPDHQPPHRDWITTGSGFDRAHFEKLWSAVAGYIAAAA